MGGVAVGVGIWGIQRLGSHTKWLPNGPNGVSLWLYDKILPKKNLAGKCPKIWDVLIRIDDTIKPYHTYNSICPWRENNLQQLLSRVLLATDLHYTATPHAHYTAAFHSCYFHSHKSLNTINRSSYIFMYASTWLPITFIKCHRMRRCEKMPSPTERKRKL